MEFSKSFVHKYHPRMFADFADINQPVLHDIQQLPQKHVLLVGPPRSSKTAVLQAIVNEYFYQHACDKPASPDVIQDNVLYVDLLMDKNATHYRTSMRQFCQITSSVPKKQKMVVVDNVDLLNEPCQQTFRTMFDKYGHSVQFVMSCTHSTRVNEGLRSRLFVCPLYPLPPESMVALMHTVLAHEQWTLPPAGQTYVLHQAQNNVNRLLSLLEKCSLLCQSPLFLSCKDTTDPLLSPPFDWTQVGMTIDHDVLQSIVDLCLPSPPTVLSDDLAASGDSNSNSDNDRNIQDMRTCIHQLHQLYAQGYAIVDIWDQLLTFVQLQYGHQPMTPALVHLMHCLAMYMQTPPKYEEELSLAMFVYDVKGT